MNRADGFSPGSALLVKVPGPTRHGSPQERPATAHEPEARPREPLALVVINAPGKRRPVWAEID
jgi:hypothetical protein